MMRTMAQGLKEHEKSRSLLGGVDGLRRNCPGEVARRELGSEVDEGPVGGLNHPRKLVKGREIELAADGRPLQERMRKRAAAG